MRPSPIFRLLAASAAFVAFAASAQPPTAPWPTKEWTVSTPQAEGLDPAVLADLADYLATPAFQTDSMLVVRHGRIVAEAYASPVHAGLRHDLRSVTKSVVATVVGTAIQEGRIASTEQRALAFFPEHPASGARQDALTLRHLLDMTSGIAWREWPYNAESDALKLWAAPDWTRFILARDFSSAPGERFQYMAAAPHLLSVILTRSGGENAAEYARHRLFKVLGITDFAWRSDPQGHSVGESTLRLAPRDMARIGLLYLRDGRWDGEQLLPPGWTEALFAQPGIRHSLPDSPPTYRSLWWTDTSVPYAAAIGRHGQYIILLPRQDLMLVVTSKTADRTRGASAPVLVRNYLLPAADGARAQAGSLERLTHALARFGDQRGPGSREPGEGILALARKAFVLEPNAWNYTEFGVTLSGAQPSYWLMQADRKAGGREIRRGGAMGLDGRYVVSDRAGDKGWARRGRWIDENTFRIETQELESAVVAEWTARFLEDGRLELLYTNGDGDTLQMRGRVKEGGEPTDAARHAAPVAP